MKTSFLISILAIFFHLETHAMALQLSLPFGSEEKIIKIKELPNVSNFQLKDGTYYDVGSMYTKKQFLWLGYSFGEPEYVGYINSQEMYVPLSATDVNNLASLAQIQLPEDPQISFFDKYISRLLLLLIIGITTYFSYFFYRKRKARITEDNTTEMPTWPPTAAH